jgi:hypothetical protein
MNPRETRMRTMINGLPKGPEKRVLVDLYRALRFSNFFPPGATRAGANGSRLSKQTTSL